MSSTPWFRFYSEALRDPKIAEIADITEQPEFVVMGFWTGLLCLANESPYRGQLWLTDSKAMSQMRILKQIDANSNMGKALFDAFLELELISLVDNVYVISQWDKRQFKSDNSTERSREWRRKQKATKTSDEGGGDCYTQQLNGVEANNDATLHATIDERPETEAETYTDKDSQNAHVRKSDPDKDRLNALADSLAAVCEVDLKTASQGLRKKTQRAVISLDGFGATPELVTGFSGWWWGDSSPQPWQVVDYWKKYLNKDKQNGQKSTRASERTIVKPERTAGNNPYFAPDPDKRVSAAGLPIAPELLAKLEQQSGTISQ